MRWALILGVALWGCDDSGHSVPDFQPIGRPLDGGSLTGPDAAPFAPMPDATVLDSDGGVLPLALEFEPIVHDAQALRITDMAFLPSPAGDFLLTDKDGEVVHMRLEGDGARRLGAFTVPDVWFDSDAGLISVAVDPNFSQNHWIYLGYCTSKETNVITRFELNAEDYEATAASGVNIIEVTGERAPRSWHNVGSIGFTSEGYLWGLFGDKVLGEVAHDVMSPLGALLRVMPLAEGGFEVPPDNPFADGSGHPAVYAKGMRSPWTGLYRGGRWVFGDIGLDAVEEINVVSAPGQDFGWPGSEGPCQAQCDSVVDPWMHYGRGTQLPLVAENPQVTASRLRSVWIGWQYLPTENDPYDGRWDGVLTFGDFYLGSVRARNVTGSGPSWHAGHFPMLTAWAQAPDGYVYAAAIGTWPPDAPMVPSPILRVVLAEPEPAPAPAP